MEITDATGLIPATIFVEKAEELYNITVAEMVNNTTDVCYTTPSSRAAFFPSSSPVVHLLSTCISS